MMYGAGSNSQQQRSYFGSGQQMPQHHQQQQHPHQQPPDGYPVSTYPTAHFAPRDQISSFPSYNDTSPTINQEEHLGGRGVGGGGPIGIDRFGFPSASQQSQQHPHGGGGDRATYLEQPQTQLPYPFPNSYQRLPPPPSIRPGVSASATPSSNSPPQPSSSSSSLQQSFGGASFSYDAPSVPYLTPSSARPLRPPPPKSANKRSFTSASAKLAYTASITAAGSTTKKKTRVQFSSCQSCRGRRVKCDLKDQQALWDKRNGVVAMGDMEEDSEEEEAKPGQKQLTESELVMTRGEVRCQNCQDRNQVCIDEFAQLKADKAMGKKPARAKKDRDSKYSSSHHHYTAPDASYPSTSYSHIDPHGGGGGGDSQSPSGSSVDSFPGVPMNPSASSSSSQPIRLAPIAGTQTAWIPSDMQQGGYDQRASGEGGDGSVPMPRPTNYRAFSNQSTHSGYYEEGGDGPQQQQQQQYQAERDGSSSVHGSGFYQPGPEVAQQGGSYVSAFNQQQQAAPVVVSQHFQEQNGPPSGVYYEGAYHQQPIQQDQSIHYETNVVGYPHSTPLHTPIPNSDGFQSQQYPVNHLESTLYDGSNSVDTPQPGFSHIARPEFPRAATEMARPLPNRPTIMYHPSSYDSAATPGMTGNYLGEEMAGARGTPAYSSGTAVPIESILHDPIGEDELEEEVEDEIAVLPELKPGFLKSAFFRRFYGQRPILAHEDFSRRYLSANPPTAAAMGPEGALLCHTMYAWAVSYGVDEAGEQITPDNVWMNLSLEKKEAIRQQRRRKTNAVVRYVLNEIDQVGIMRRHSWDGVKVLLLILPLTEDVSPPRERLSMYECGLLQVLSLCSYERVSYDGYTISSKTSPVGEVARVTLYWYAFVHEGLTTALRGGKLILTEDDLSAFQVEAKKGWEVVPSGLSKDLARFATAPVRLSMACRLIHKGLTGPSARRSPKVKSSIIYEAWESLEQCFVEFESMADHKPMPGLEQDDMVRYADGWRVFLFEAQNTILQSLKARLHNPPSPHLNSGAFAVDISRSNTDEEAQDQVELQKLYDIARSKCENMVTIILNIVRRHAGTSFFFADASLVRDGVYYTAILLAKEKGSHADIESCLQVLSEIGWGYAKAEERSSKLREMWQQRLGGMGPSLENLDLNMPDAVSGVEKPGFFPLPEIDDSAASKVDFLNALRGGESTVEAVLPGLSTSPSLSPSELPMGQAGYVNQYPLVTPTLAVHFNSHPHFVDGNPTSGFPGFNSMGIPTATPPFLDQQGQSGLYASQPMSRDNSGSASSMDTRTMNEKNRTLYQTVGIPPYNQDRMHQSRY